MTVGIGTPSFGSLVQPASTPTPASYDPASTPPAQNTLPKVSLPNLSGIPNIFTENKLSVTNPPQSVDLNTITTPKTGVETPSANILNLGRDTGQGTQLSPNLLSLQGINPQAPVISQGLEFAGLPPEEVTKVNSLEQQIMGQQILNEKIKAVAPKPS